MVKVNCNQWFSCKITFLSPSCSQTLTHTLKCWEVPLCCEHRHHHHYQLPSLGDCHLAVNMSVHKLLSWDPGHNRGLAQAAARALHLSCWSEGWCTPWRSRRTYNIWHRAPTDCQSDVSHWAIKQNKRKQIMQLKSWPCMNWLKADKKWSRHKQIWDEKMTLPLEGISAGRIYMRIIQMLVFLLSCCIV